MSQGTISVRDEELADPRDGVPCLVRAMCCDRPFDPPSRVLLGELDKVQLGRGDGSSLEERTLMLRFPDDRMSTVHGTLTRDGDRFVLVDDGSKNGIRVNGRRCETAQLTDGDVLELGHTFFIYRACVPRDLSEAPTAIAASAGELSLMTFVAGLARQLDRAARVAPSAEPIIVLGETGTGKELVARAIHRMSARTGPFVAINCGAIPERLIESELFGARRGAFSGSVEDRPGLVRAADGGTLFLDEIGELPPHAQVALLRVLQEQEVTPVGSTKPIKIDIRIVAATHDALDQLVDAGAFRTDLFARIAGLTIRLPALRERREDLGLIMATILRRSSSIAPRFTLSRQAARALFAYPFRHNIRELERVLGLAIAIATSSAPPDGPIQIELAHLPDELHASASPKSAAEREDDERKAQLLALLARHQGRLTEVARAMGKARMQIHRWIQRYGIDLESFRKSRS